MHPHHHLRDTIFGMTTLTHCGQSAHPWPTFKDDIFNVCNVLSCSVCLGFLSAIFKDFQFLSKFCLLGNLEESVICRSLAGNLEESMARHLASVHLFLFSVMILVLIWVHGLLLSLP